MSNMKTTAMTAEEEIAEASLETLAGYPWVGESFRRGCIMLDTVRSGIVSGAPGRGDTALTGILLTMCSAMTQVLRELAALERAELERRAAAQDAAFGLQSPGKRKTEMGGVV